MTAPHELEGLGSRYLSALRYGDPVLVEEAIDAAVAMGVPPGQIHADVIAPAMVEIGDLWARKALSVADEHLATALAMRSLDRLFPTRVAPQPNGALVIAAVAEGDHHVIGTRMAADLLELGGFRVRFLGADVPTSDLVDLAIRVEPTAVCLSATMSFAAEPLSRAVGELRRAVPAAALVVGGAAVPAGLRNAEGVEYCDRVDRITEVLEAHIAQLSREVNFTDPE